VLVVVVAWPLKVVRLVVVLVQVPFAVTFTTELSSSIFAGDVARVNGSGLPLIVCSVHVPATDAWVGVVVSSPPHASAANTSAKQTSRRISFSDR
jgi:hypothetical protein